MCIFFEYKWKNYQFFNQKRKDLVSSSISYLFLLADRQV